MEPCATAALLKRLALREGFDRAGIAVLGPIERGAELAGWLERGDHASMSWMERRVETRLDPRRLFPEARSVLCVALQYAPLDGAPEPEGDLWPRVARYARGRDYHNVIGKRLRKLSRKVREAFPGAQTRCYVDTGPVMEREVAARAGLGAVGKNTLLLHPEAGSWFLLGELFTSLELAPDPPIADLCGSCTRCLEACPTGALTGPYRLDSRKCISYWTIEHRGDLPPEARAMIGDWIFGCDLCQEACPINLDPQPPARDPAFALPAPRAELDLAALLAMDRSTFEQRFHGSPMQRAKRAGLRRNAAVAMGNRGQAKYVAPLAEALYDEDGGLRKHAAWALGRIDHPAARQALEAALATEREPDVASEIAAGIGP